MHTIGQSGGFLGRPWGSLLKTGWAKSVLIPLRSTIEASARVASIHKKMFGSGNTALIISNEEINDIMKIIKSVKESGLLIKSVSESIKNGPKEQKNGFFSMLLGTLDAGLSGNLLTGRGTIRTQFLMTNHPLTNSEIQLLSKWTYI